MQVQRHALALVRLEPLKLMSGVGNALCDCKLRFEHGRSFIGWALLFALLPTHKNIIKSSSPRCKAVKENKRPLLGSLVCFLRSCHEGEWRRVIYPADFHRRPLLWPLLYLARINSYCERLLFRSEAVETVKCRNNFGVLDLPFPLSPIP